MYREFDYAVLPMQWGPQLTGEPLDFLDLHSDNDCRCTNDLTENCNDTFVRDMGEARVRDKSFLSKWEISVKKKGDQGDIKDCEKVCNRKGVSLTPCPSLEQHLNTRRRSLEISPSLPWFREYYCFLRFAVGAGVVRIERDDHASLFKSDSFAVKAHVVTLRVGRYRDV